ncbi:MAG: LamG-like jellyroll fold domain-containing protein, partial [Bacteroidales bacterium]
IGLWGAHSQNMLWESRGEKGALPTVQQRTYMLRAERYFTGGTRNPVNTPALSNSMSYNADNYDFFGMSKMMSAKSSLSWDLATEPFITYFNLGNGTFFNRNGKTESNREWYNIGIQDYLPTWRWWFADSFMGRTPENVPAKGLDAEFVWSDAWFGGSLMRVFGSHANEYLHLFKTQFLLKGGDEITVRYKVMGGSTDLTLALSAEGNENTVLAENGLKVIESSSIEIGEWVEKKFIIRGALTALNNKTLAMVALHFTNAQNLDLYLGEFSIVRGSFAAPATPVIEKTVVLAANHKGLDGKIIFNMPNDKPANEVCYNLDVKTAVFNLYAQQEGKEPVLMGATTSWAGMYYAIPFDYTVENAKVRLGVSAVSLDMKNESEITWGEYAEPGAYTINDDISINKTTIKPNEDFEIKFIDAKHEPSKWEIIDGNNNVVASAENAIAISVENGFSEIGAYSLRVTGNVQQADGSRKEVERTFGSFVQITSTTVGALPKILSLTGNDKESDIEVGISAPIALKYTGRSADGVGSQGVDLNEKGFGFRASDMGMQPGKSFTLAFWVKVNKYNGGTQFINIRDKQEGWPKTDWGWFWNFLNDEGKYTSITFRGTDATSNNELQYQYDNAKVEAGPWTHLAYVFEYNNAGNIKFHLYINGVKQEVARWKRSTDSGYKTGEPDFQGNVYGMRGANMVAFGGTHHSNNGVDGTLDNFQYWDKALTAEEVKATMESFETIPENLVGYWDFEVGANNEDGFVSTGTNKEATAGVHEYIAATGEGMGNIKYVAPTFKPGCPFVEGSNYKVVTKPSWSADKGSISDIAGSDVAGSANVSFAKAGTYSATLTLENGWGTDSKTINYIKVDTGAGIEDITLESELSAYPNPFINDVNICFAQDGEYTVRVYNLSGSLVAEKTQSIASGEFV